MALFQRWRDLRRPTVIYVSGRADAGIAVANMDAATLYRTQPNLRAVVSFLADNAAQVPLKVHDRAGENDRPRVTDSAAALLLKQPNADMTAFEFKRWLYSDLLLYERHMSLIAPSVDAPSGWELRPIPGEWILEYKGTSPFAPESVVVGVPGNAAIEIPADKFILFHGYSPTDPMRQCNRISALAETLHEQVESNAFRRQMWRRGGRFNMYLTRPKDVERWTSEAFERFKESWKASWAGSDAGEGGGTPILEDGMEIRNVQFNSRDAQWAEAVRLSREDCAAVYHVNPALIWPGSGQTYASAKDNARALYNDSLAPLLMQATDRINQDLLARIGEPPGHYVVYDITIKTQGTFEERVSAGQTACGVPFMTINEVRGEFNLPAIDGGDKIVQPMNMLYGGLASTHDTDPTRERYNSLTEAMDEAERILGVKSADGAEVAADPKAPEPPVVRKAAGDPPEEDEERIVAVYRAFFERQAESVIPKMAAGGAWWNERRWNSELAADLWPVAASIADAAGERAVAQLWPDDPTRGYARERTGKYIRSMCERRAEVVNAATKRQLDAAIAGGKSAKAYDDDDDEEYDEDAPPMSTPQGVFENAEKNRASTAGRAFAAALTGFGMLEACRQNVRRGENVFKVWRTRSGRPRSSHAAMNGERVQYDQEFSNGMMWPGAMSANVSAAETANCRCATDLEKDERDWTPGRITAGQIDARDDLSSTEKKMLKQAVSDAKKPFGLRRSRKLADKMGECMKARADAYRAIPRLSRTQDQYDATVGALISDIGDVYGMRLTGGFAEGASKIDPTKVLESAIPNGDELWAVTRMRGRFREAHFLSIDRGIRKGNPDLFVNGRYIDIKTPDVKENIKKRVNAASHQCRNRGQEDGAVILSLLRLGDEFELSERVIKERLNSGWIGEAYIVRVDSSVTAY